MDFDLLSDDELVDVLVAGGFGETTARFYVEHRDHEDWAERIPYALNQGGG